MCQKKRNYEKNPKNIPIYQKLRHYWKKNLEIIPTKKKDTKRRTQTTAHLCFLFSWLYTIKSLKILIISKTVSMLYVHGGWFEQFFISFINFLKETVQSLYLFRPTCSSNSSSSTIKRQNRNRNTNHQCFCICLLYFSFHQKIIMNEICVWNLLSEQSSAEEVFSWEFCLFFNLWFLLSSFFRSHFFVFIRIFWD